MTTLKIFFYGPWDILKLLGMHFGFYVAIMLEILKRTSIFALNEQGGRSYHQDQDKPLLHAPHFTRNNNIYNPNTGWIRDPSYFPSGQDRDILVLLVSTHVSREGDISF